jgi:hypothetical protein
LTTIRVRLGARLCYRQATGELADAERRTAQRVAILLRPRGRSNCSVQWYTHKRARPVLQIETCWTQMRDEKSILHDRPWYEPHNREEQTQREGSLVLRPAEEQCELFGEGSVCNVTKSPPSQSKGGSVAFWGTTVDSPIDWFQ